MSSVPRIGVASFTVWLIVSWTLPVCCLSMTAARASRADAQSTALAMPGHHHHDSSSESNQSSTRFSANESCTQSCVNNPELVMSLPAKNDLGTFRQTVIESVSLPVHSVSTVQFDDSATAPLPILPRASRQPISLRI